MNFIVVIEACRLLDIGFSGHKFTLSNKRGSNHKIWKSIDKAMVNDSLFEEIPKMTITHLPDT